MRSSTCTEALARFGHAVSDPTRTKVLLALRKAPSCPTEWADHAGVSRQTMSNQLVCLRSCGPVVALPESRRTRYELVDQRISHALGDLPRLAQVVDPHRTCVDEAQVNEHQVVKA